MPQLIFYVESGYPQIHNLLSRKTTIGRSEENDIHLPDPRVSEFHAEVVRLDAGSYQLNDLGSNLGTAVDGKLIDEKTLEHGAPIKFGSVNAAYVDLSESAEDKLLRETAEKDLVNKRGELTSIQATIEARNKVLQAIPESEGKLADLQESISELESRNETERNRLEAIQNELEAHRQQRSDLDAELKTRQEDLNSLDKERIELQVEYRKLRTANEYSERLKEELDSELEKLREEIEQQKYNLREHSKAHEEAKVVIEEAKAIQARMDEFELGLKSLTNAYEDLGIKITEREALYVKLGDDIDQRNSELGELEKNLEIRYQAAEKLGKVIIENNDHIKSSSEMLENMELTLQKEIDEVAHSQETKETLHQESLSLSNLISGKTAILKRLNEKFNARKDEPKEIITCPPLRIVNPAMRSLVQYFQHGAGVPDQDRVNPIGIFGLAACTKGSMHRDWDTMPTGDDPVLVFLHGDFAKDKALIESVSRENPNRILLICWRKGQLDALAAEQEQPVDSNQLNHLLGPVSGLVSVDSRTAEIIDGLKLARPHLNLPLPVPVEVPEWNSPVPDTLRPRGIFVTVNEFDPDSKVHRSRLELLNRLVNDTKTNVSVYHPNPAPELVEALAVPTDLITDLSSPLKYSECLDFMRQHHFVTGFGSLEGSNPMGDAMLSKTIFIGADFNRVMDHLLFPDFCIKGGESVDNVLNNAKRMLSDHGAFLGTIEQAQSLALELISFETVNERLSEFLLEVTPMEAQEVMVGTVA